ncbi:hypothetical protein MPER_01127, partial [Moniliophthora perniciosa FA553]
MDRTQDNQSQADVDPWVPQVRAIVHSSVFQPADDDGDDDDAEVQVHIVPATPSFEMDDWDLKSSGGDDEVLGLLPDDSWIAIVCGVSKEQWERQQQLDGDDGGLPENFFVAPRDVYMPDLTAIADVLLGKLGYGTVA